jgi:predicted secreted Zn-dependent protease
MKLAAPQGVITTVHITADITLEMPAWTPPTTMLPKAKAEWRRAYAALLAHENGHIKLVHDVFDGLAAKLLGKTSAVGKAMFATAKAKLATDSKAYDKKTANGQNTGTIIDVGIEQQEIDEAAKKKSAGTADKKDAGAPPS